jgi:hypothetical protein
MDASKALGAAMKRISALGFGLWALLVASAMPAWSAERYAIVISGASGGEKYAEQQKKWRSELLSFLTTGFSFSDANIVVMDEDGAPSSKATADNVRRLFGDLRRKLTADDTVMLVLIGHGTFDGTDAKFNLVGPDLSAGEWREMLDGLPGRLIAVNTTESSFPFLEELSQRGRVVITATDSAGQRYTTVFPEYFIRALADSSSDLDKNNRVSIFEAFTVASANVRLYYEQKGQLSTERPLLDDDGDGVGHEAGAPGDDGTLARAVFLDPEPGSGVVDVATAALTRQRLVLERQLEDLKSRKASMSEADYQAELERILTELSKISQRIRSGS